MPIDGQSTRQRPHEPKSTPEAKLKGADGEPGVPPTERRTPAGPPPTSRNPPPTPPASFASMVDAKEHLRTQNPPQNQLEILSNRSGSHDFVNKQRRETILLSTVDTSGRTLNSLYTTDVFTYTDSTLIVRMVSQGPIPREGSESHRCTFLLHALTSFAHFERQTNFQR